MKTARTPPARTASDFSYCDFLFCVSYCDILSLCALKECLCSSGKRLPLSSLKSMKDANPDPNPIDRAAYRDITHQRLAEKMGTDLDSKDSIWGSTPTGESPSAARPPQCAPRLQGPSPS